MPSEIFRRPQNFFANLSSVSGHLLPNRLSKITQVFLNFNKLRGQKVFTLQIEIIFSKIRNKSFNQQADAIDFVNKSKPRFINSAIPLHKRQL